MSTTTSQIESRAAAYLDKLPPAVAGNGGHRATFAAACRIVEFGIPFNRALPLLTAWDATHCQPRWTEAELRHKLADAYKRTSPKPEFMNGTINRNSRPGFAAPAPKPALLEASYQSAGRKRASATASPESAQLAATIRALLDLNQDKAHAAASKSATPAVFNQVANLVRDIQEQNKIKALANLRGLSAFGLTEAYRRGLLRFDNYLGLSSWLLLDKSFRNACARRMDGLPWNPGKGNASKTMILRGSQAKWPLGIREAQNYPNILLCEGGPDFLSAFHVIWGLGCKGSFAPVAMLSASYPVHTDALRLFKGKRVRIFAHNDWNGAQAAQKWKSQIAGHVTQADIFTFVPYRVKDLNDYIRAKCPIENLLR